MENDKKASALHILKIAAVLTVITTVTAVLLSVISIFTEPVILEHQEEKKKEAILSLFPDASGFRSLDDDIGQSYPPSVSGVYAVYRDDRLLGFCTDISSDGFADKISMMVGITAEQTVCGIRVLSIADTPGLGMNAAEPDYLASYEGLHYPVTFSPGSADCISGATYSSAGILNGVNEALRFCSEIAESDTGTRPAEEETPETDASSAEAVTETIPADPEEGTEETDHA